MLALLSKPEPENMEPKSPPKSRLPPSSVGGVAVLVVEEVMPRALPWGSSCWRVGIAGTSGGGSLVTGGGTEFFFWPPNEKVRPALFRKLEGLDFGVVRLTMSCKGFLVVRCSSCPLTPMSADDGAVDALLCRDEASVDVALVVFEAPLPRLPFMSAKILSSMLRSTIVLGRGRGVPDALARRAPPSNDLPPGSSVRSITRKEDCSGAATCAF
jgi:hypothetical protein